MVAMFRDVCFGKHYGFGRLNIDSCVTREYWVCKKKEIYILLKYLVLGLPWQHCIIPSHVQLAINCTLCAMFLLPDCTYRAS
jgi:hypothetical protein